nr:integrase, catalytic region, zinc finger, CCHC-type, peptidase aspartic, catalytic [Tanacetum cinerariifolium]
MAGLLFKIFKEDRIEFRGIMQGEQLQLVMREFRTELAMQILVKQSRLNKMLLMQAQENGVVLDEEKLLFIAGGQENAFDDDVDEPPAPTAQTMFMANLSSDDPIYDEAGPSYDSDILSKAAQCVSANEQSKVVSASLTAELVRYKEQVELYEDGQKDTLEIAEKTTIEMLEKMKSILWLRSTKMDKKSVKIKRKNLLIENENLIADCLSNEVFYTATNYVLTVARYSEMHDGYTAEQARCLELEAEISKLKHKIQKDDHSEMIKRFSNFEVNHLNLQLKYQHLKESFGNNKSRPAQDAPKFDLVSEIKKMKASLQGKDNTIRKLKVKISKLMETFSEADPTFDFRALDFQITELTEKVITTALLAKNENLKAQIKEKMKCVTTDSVKPKVLTPDRIDHPLVFRLRLLKTYDGESLMTQNFVKKFIGTVRFEKDHFGAIMGYGDYVIVNSVIFRCMTRSSSNKLFTPYKDPEREFRSSRRHFNTLDLDELKSPDFNLLSDQEYSEEEVAKTMAETIEQYMSKTRANYGSRVSRPKIENKDNFKLKGKFLKELCTNIFSGLDHEDANEHIEKVIEIVDLFHIPNITIDQVMLRAFPMSLTGATSPIQAQLNNLRRETKKVNEKVYAAQVE